MNIRTLLVASLTANALLVGLEVYLLRQDATDLEYPPPLILCVNHANPAAGEATAAGTAPITNDLRHANWRRIASEDYAHYVARLRSLGCPEQTVRDIVAADVNEMFRRRAEKDVYTATRFGR